MRLFLLNFQTFPQSRLRTKAEFILKAGMLPLQLRQFVWSFILLWRMEEVSCWVVSRHIAFSLLLRSASYNGDVSEVRYYRKSISRASNPFCIHPQACYGCYFWDQQDAHPSAAGKDVLITMCISSVIIRR